MRTDTMRKQARTIQSRLLTWKHYYVYVNPLSGAESAPAPVAGASFTCRELPITLAEYESVARAGVDLRAHAVAAARAGEAPRTFVFLTVANDAVVNVTGMTATRTGSVYSQVERFWPSYTEDRETLFAGYSETAPEHRRKGVYSWVHGMIFAWARENGFRRVVLLEGEDQPGPRRSQDKLGSTVVAETCHVTLFSGLRSKYRVQLWVNVPWLVRLLASHGVE